MIETLLFDTPSIARYEKAPYAEERLRYLTHCAQRGDTRKSLQNKQSSVGALRSCGRASHKAVTPRAGPDGFFESTLAVGKTYVLVQPRKRAGIRTLFADTTY
jgi:hypothetical protein